MIPLTLAMIVRNEAEVLPGFFKHHQGMWGEIVVVDTGSTDGTVDLCRQAGCRLVEVPWQDDFSAARNAGLDLVTGLWTLILDADERLSPADLPRLQDLCAGAPDKVYLQETLNYTPNRTHLEWQPVTGRDPQAERGQAGFFAARRAGLFPTRKDLRFTGRIHESILPQATSLGLEAVPCAIPVHHYGYVRSQEVNSARQARYLNLAQLKLASDPDDPGALLELATGLLEAGRPADAQPLLERLVQGKAGLSHVVRGHFLLGRLLREQGQLAAAEDLLSRGVEQDPAFRFTRLELIRVRGDLEQWRSVNDLLEEAKAYFGPDSPLFMREELRLCIKTGQLPRAGRLARRLAEICPDWTEIVSLAQKLEALTGG